MSANKSSSAAPKHWQTLKVKYLVSLQSGNSIDTKAIRDEGDFPVYGGNGLRGYTNEFTHEGDRILIGRQGALCGNINYGSGRFWATEHAIVATPRREFDVTWLGESLRAMNLNQYSQSAAQPGIAAEVVGNLNISVPPLAEQKRISHVLTNRISRLDLLIDEKQRFLDLLVEKRNGLIAQAVTQGVNPNVSRRDSGILWLGLFPTHWKVVRAKVLFREIDERSETGEETLLSLRMTKGLVPHNDVSEKVITPVDLIGYKKAWPRQIVINRMRAASGLIAVVPQEGLVSPDYAVFEPAEGVTPEFFTYLFQTPLLQAVFRSESKGLGTGQSGFLRLYSENFLAIHLPVPPLDEQLVILEWIRDETRKIDAFAMATEKTIQLLQERRTALISAAVTGQLDLGT
jgi:type I restriction enzyme S subunit